MKVNMCNELEDMRAESREEDKGEIEDEPI